MAQSLYHASKWGIEGFIEAVMQEVAPFNIGVTIIEPGGARTAFRFGGAQLGPKMDVYEGTPVGMTRRMLQDTSRLPHGDPVKMVKVMINSEVRATVSTCLIRLAVCCASLNSPRCA